MVDCCKLVGNFPVTVEGIISISSKGKTDVQVYSDGSSVVSVVGPSTGTVSISAYASKEVHYGCFGRASVSVNWIKKSNCDTTTFIYAGQGFSSISGDVGGLVSFPSTQGVSQPLAEMNVLNVSAASGPAALYEDYTQQDGYGLIFTGNPWNINTSSEEGASVDLSNFGLGDYTRTQPALLQSLSLQLTPGELPVVSMDFIYQIDN
jgi:hypothetical protein